MATLKQIQYFLLLAKELHFARTASKLGITQATLSGEIKKLEKKFGFALFDRSNKWEIRLTEAGESYLQHIEQVPDIISNAYKAAAGTARGEAGVIKISITHMVYDLLNIGKLCKQMFSRYPGIVINIDDQLSPEAVEKNVLLQKADVGFTTISRYRVPPEHLVIKKLMPMNLNLILPVGHPLADKLRISYDDLKDCEFILPPATAIPVLRQLFNDIFMRNAGAIPKITHELESLSGIQQFVAENFGIAVLPERVPNIFPERIIARPFPEDIDSYLAIAISDCRHSAALNNFMTVLDSFVKHSASTARDV